MSKELIYKFRMPIGDWSNDGHGKCEEFYFLSNYPVIDLQNAYKASCKKTGVQFNHNQNYTGIESLASSRTDRNICCQYDESSITELGQEILNKHGISTEEFEEDHETDQFVAIIMKFISLSMPEDFIYEEAEVKRSEIKKIPPLNGWWNDQLNCQFGAGLFY